MGTRTKRVERGSQATPLAEDVIQQLRGQLSEGAFGLGVGPLQREAGTSLRQYLTSLEQREPVDTASLAGMDLTQLIGDLENISARNVNRQAADLQEAFGGQGTRFGSTLARGESALRGDAALDLSAMIGNILREENARVQAARQFDVGANLGLGQQRLGAIGQLFGQGQAALAPFLALAQMGILPEEIIAQPNPWAQLGGAALTAGAGILGGPAGGVIANRLFEGATA